MGQVTWSSSIMKYWFLSFKKKKKQNCFSVGGMQFGLTSKIYRKLLACKMSTKLDQESEKMKQSPLSDLIPVSLSWILHRKIYSHVQ